jgi:hypothetical protein
VRIRAKAEIPRRLLKHIEQALAAGADRTLVENYQEFRLEGMSHERIVEALARSTFRMPHPDAQVIVKDNPCSYLLADAQHMLRQAQKATRHESRLTEALYARSSILLHCISLEAVINFVLVYTEARSSRSLKDLSHREKWLRASLDGMAAQGVFNGKNGERYKPGDHVHTFDIASRQFGIHQELMRIRNDVVHLKPSFRFTKARSLRKELKDTRRYPLTKVPYDISQWRHKHAENVAKHVWALVRALNGFMMGRIGDPLIRPKAVEFEYASFGKRDTSAV